MVFLLKLMRYAGVFGLAMTFSAGCDTSKVTDVKKLDHSDPKISTLGKSQKNSDLLACVDDVDTSVLRLTGQPEIDGRILTVGEMEISALSPEAEGQRALQITIRPDSKTVPTSHLDDDGEAKLESLRAEVKICDTEHHCLGGEDGQNQQITLHTWTGIVVLPDSLSNPVMVQSRICANENLLTNKSLACGPWYPSEPKLVIVALQNSEAFARLNEQILAIAKEREALVTSFLLPAAQACVASNVKLKLADNKPDAAKGSILGLAERVVYQTSAVTSFFIDQSFREDGERMVQDLQAREGDDSADNDNLGLASGTACSTIGERVKKIGQKGTASGLHLADDEKIAGGAMLGLGIAIPLVYGAYKLLTRNKQVVQSLTAAAPVTAPKVTKLDLILQHNRNRVRRKICV